MKLVTLLVASTLCIGACNRADSAGSSASTHTDDPHAKLPRLEVARVAELLEEKAVVPVDANSNELRKELGTLPGAVLLSDSKSFDLAELPQDKSKNLVFYCGAERCRSAPKAAQRATEAGYTNVSVMPAGIKGWVKAGKQVHKTS